MILFIIEKQQVELRTMLVAEIISNPINGGEIFIGRTPGFLTANN